MVNREGNFNRKKVKRLKTIRDKKRARIQKKKKAIGYQDRPQVVITKKQLKREKRLSRIMGELNENDLKNITKKPIIRRRRKNQQNDNAPANNMDIDNN